MSQEVQDKQAESGIKLNNILTFLILGVMSWVGLNIDVMKSDIGEIKGDNRVQSNELGHVSKRLDEHINNEDAHNINNKLYDYLNDRRGEKQWDKYGNP